MKSLTTLFMGIILFLALGCDKTEVKETTKVAIEHKMITKAELSSSKEKKDSYNITILTADNSKGKITPKTISAVFKEAGFFINDNRDMTAPFIRNFKKVDYDVYNLFTIFRKLNVLELATKYPKIGLFSPMSMSIYTRKGTKTISISSLSVKAMAKIMGIPENDEALVEYGQLVQETLKKALPNAKVEKVSYTMKKPTGALSYTTTLTVKKGMDIEEVKDEFEEAFEEDELQANDFIMAGYNDLNYDFEEAEYEGYTFYDVYSICNLSVIYIVSQKHPEAGAFAPCSLYIYNKANTNTIEIGFPSVYNWIASLAIEDKASLDILMSAQTKMENLLTKLVTKFEK